MTKIKKPSWVKKGQREVKEYNKQKKQIKIQSQIRVKEKFSVMFGGLEIKL